MPTYECPRCNGSEYFLRNETQLRAGRTNIINNTKLKNVQQKTPVCKKCQEVMNVVFSKEEDVKKSLNQTRSFLIFGYLVCLVIGMYSILASCMQLILKINGDEYAMDFYQSGLLMVFGIIFIYLFYLIRKSDKRVKFRIEGKK